MLSYFVNHQAEKERNWRNRKKYSQKNVSVRITYNLCVCVCVCVDYIWVLQRVVVYVLVGMCGVYMRVHAPHGRFEVVTNNSVKQNIGAIEGTFRQRAYNHKLSFINRNYSSNTSLSTLTWDQKYMIISPTITLEILKLASTYSKTSKNAFFVSMKNSQFSLTHHKSPC